MAEKECREKIVSAGLGYRTGKWPVRRYAYLLHPFCKLARKIVFKSVVTWSKSLYVMTQKNQPKRREKTARNTDREQKGRKKQDGGELRRPTKATSRSCRVVTKRDHHFFGFEFLL